MTKYEIPEVILNLDQKMAYIRYPERGYIKSIDITDIGDAIDKQIKEKNKTLRATVFIHRIIMDGPNQYHIDIFQRRKDR